ncbi:unnamed protein product [Microthlaspi erraticum]|uniref:Uncharacterized protein n=1 Tax=Microthlaspi erraticum TaxID=1685480 RepID=A0A6D2JF49_9BRAS|nr:unnamed protein product [Microthlaspi erraticum]
MVNSRMGLDTSPAHISNCNLSWGSTLQAHSLPYASLRVHRPEAEAEIRTISFKKIENVSEVDVTSFYSDANR